MISRWGDFENAFALLDELRRRMDHRLDENSSLTDDVVHRFPPVSLTDTGQTLVVRADVPGLGDKDVQVAVHQDVLTITGERTVRGPDGYTCHRQERPSARFVRSLGLPCKVDVDETRAVVKNGVLHVTLPKAPESQPRQIAVRAQ
jgi:HSP20 family protein